MTQLRVQSDLSMIPTDEAADRHLVVHLTAPGRADGSKRPPIEVAFVLDRSGSMEGAKIVLAKAALAKALEALAPQDRFAIVVYDNTVDLVAAPTEATPQAKKQALDALAKVSARGGTNLASGWLTGAAQLSADAKLSRVMLLTDGLANDGETAPDALETHAAELRKRGVSLTTFGVGSDFDETLLQRLAAAGGGNFYFVAKPLQIPDFIASELGEALEVTASGAVLTVVHNPGVTVEPLSVIAAEASPNRTRLFLGSLVADQELELVLRLHLPASNSDQAVSLELSSTDGAVSGRETAVWKASPLAVAASETPDGEVIREVAAIDLARAAQKAVALNRSGQYGAAFAAMSATLDTYDRYADLDAGLAANLAQTRSFSPTYSSLMSESQLKGTYWQASNLARGRSATGAARRKAEPKK
jgi:Ca-activated chloride channel homolog